MQKEIPVNLNALSAMADSAAFGAAKSGVDLRHHTQEAILLDRQALLEAGQLYWYSRGDLGLKRGFLESLTETAQMFVTGTRDMLKLRLGKRYSTAWAGTGFEGSLESPRTAVELLPIVEQMQGFLGTHPEYEVSQLNLTAARAGELFADLNSAFTGVIAQKTTCAQLLIARDGKAKTLRKRLRGLINELDYLLESNDPRWRLFGLNMPDTVQRPEQPENVAVKLINNRDAYLTWEAPARAERYHVFQRIVGIDSEPLNLGTSYESDFVLEALPPQSTIEIMIRALNEGGESALSVPVRIVTPSIAPGTVLRPPVI